MGGLNEIKELVFENAPSRARRIVKNGDTIWSMVRPNRKSYLLVLDPDPNMVVSTGFAVISPREVPFSWVYLTLTTEEFVGYLTGHATGAAYPAVTSDVFEKARLIIPPQEILTRFHNQLEPCFRQIEANNRENIILASTRGYLLPKLLSGEIEVKRAEKQMAEFV